MTPRKDELECLSLKLFRFCQHFYSRNLNRGLVKEAVLRANMDKLLQTWLNIVKRLPCFIEYSAHFFYIENDAEIFPAHYTSKVAEKGFKMAFMMNILAMIIILVKLFLKNKNINFAKTIVKFRCARYLYVHYTR